MDFALNDEQKERLRHRIPPRYLTKKGEVVISADGSRDQDANRADCRQKLANALREGLKRPKQRRKTKPSRGASRPSPNTAKRSNPTNAKAGSSGWRLHALEKRERRKTCTAETLRSQRTRGGRPRSVLRLSAPATR